MTLQLAPKDDEPRGSTVFIAGPPKSGKSALAWRQYASRMPRLVTIEVVAETHRLDARAKVARGWDELEQLLNELAETERFHVIAFLNRESIEQLFRLLCPDPESGATSYSRAIGGLAVQCGELKYMAAIGLGNQSAIADAYARYRHYWLTIIGATQRPAQVDPCTRTIVDRCVFLRTSAALDLKAIAQLTSPAIAELVRELPKYHSITCIDSDGIGYIADAGDRVYDVVDYRGVSTLSSSVTNRSRSRGQAQQAGESNPAPVATNRQRRA